jgi:hypothetical protein
MALALSAISCSRSPGTPAAASSSAESGEYRRFSVTVVGYNYTDTGIGYFGAAFGPGGNVEVSTPTAGGGKSACCGAVSPLWGSTAAYPCDGHVTATSIAARRCHCAARRLPTRSTWRSTSIAMATSKRPSAKPLRHRGFA